VDFGLRPVSVGVDGPSEAEVGVSEDARQHAHQLQLVAKEPALVRHNEPALERGPTPQSLLHQHRRE
jgi:hypothetical protein